MDQFALAKQMIDFNKNTFENTCDTMCVLQEQSEKIINTFVAQAPWVPDEGKKMIADMTAAYKKGLTEFRKAVNDNFGRMEAYFDQVGKAQ
jgi:polyhydroxyalkanoate synthesis regulator phasin